MSTFSVWSRVRICGCRTASIRRRLEQLVDVWLETNDDVAALVQSVYEMYLRAPAETPPKIIALVSQDAARRNPRLRAWLINHQAAVLATFTWDTIGFRRDLLEFIRRAREVDV